MVLFDVHVSPVSLLIPVGFTYLKYPLLDGLTNCLEFGMLGGLSTWLCMLDRLDQEQSHLILLQLYLIAGVNSFSAFVQMSSSLYTWLVVAFPGLTPVGGYSIFFRIRRLGPSIYRSPPKISGISSTPPKIF